MQKSAIISACTLFRYMLTRQWDSSLPYLVVCMLNPSTADANLDDPTILRLIHFATLWGYGGIYVVNENAFRAASPLDMMKASDRRGPDNYAHINLACRIAHDTPDKIALVAWGNGSDGVMFLERARAYKLNLVCLGTTNSGQPKHPMARGNHRIPNDQQPEKWRVPIW